jgi:hypothetical protein
MQLNFAAAHKHHIQVGSPGHAQGVARFAHGNRLRGCAYCLGQGRRFGIGRQGANAYRKYHQAFFAAEFASVLFAIAGSGRFGRNDEFVLWRRYLRRWMGRGLLLRGGFGFRRPLCSLGGIKCVCFRFGLCVGLGHACALQEKLN